MVEDTSLAKNAHSLDARSLKVKSAHSKLEPTSDGFSKIVDELINANRELKSSVFESKV